MGVCVFVYAFQDLYDHQLLHLLIKGRGSNGSPVDTIPSSTSSIMDPLTQSCRGYSLRIVGHSLGAGKEEEEEEEVLTIELLVEDHHDDGLGDGWYFHNRHGGVVVVDAQERFPQLEVSVL